MIYIECTKINHLNRTSKSNFYCQFHVGYCEGRGKVGVKAIFIHISEREFTKPLNESRTKFTYDSAAFRLYNGRKTSWYTM